MAEYLAPGVYVEEVSFRSKSIEGVPTSTTGFAGMTRTGPVQHPGGPSTTEPRLVTSFTEFERVYGGLEDLRQAAEAADPEVPRTAYAAHAVRAFFLNGGKRLYFSRVFAPRDDGGAEDWGVAFLEVPVGGDTATWRARWPGAFGNVAVRTVGAGGNPDSPAVRSRVSTWTHDDFGVQVRGVRHGAVVEVLAAGSTVDDTATVDTADLRVVLFDPDGRQRFWNESAAESAPAADAVVSLVELNVLVQVAADRTDFYEGLGTHPDQTRYIGHVLDRDHPEDEGAVVWLDWDAPPDGADPFAAANLMAALAGAAAGGAFRLHDGRDGALAQPADLAGQEAAPDDPGVKATGLEALAEVEDIAIVALPDGGTYGDELLVRGAADALITHAERARYRIAVVDGPSNASLNAIRDFRGRFDSKYAALYHPWIEILDPTRRPAQGAAPPRILLPPSGFVTGIYARTDVERGVHKAPANEVVRGLTRFEININKARQDVLNPQGINALRFFEGRGSRVWGARTMSSDPEWKYVNVRRLFIYIERSIDVGTQWAVFEPNNRRLWDNIRNTVEDFLLTLWQQGALLGDKPEEAYFVRCDRTTMTQNDLDNGRLICLVGIAPTRPAEFVIFRVGQWTADAKQS